MYFFTDCFSASSLASSSLIYAFSAAVTQAASSGFSFIQNAKMKANTTAGIASTINNVRHPCKPKKVVSSNTPANGPPIILENNRDVSIKEIAFARSLGKNQLGINKE